MSFLKLILKNPFRSKSRALLAIIGIGIGIATIVALGAVTDGMIASADDILHAGGYDFTIEGKTDENTSSTSMMSFGTTTFNENYLEKISKIKGVKEVVGIYMATPRTEKSPMFVLIGMNSSAKNLAELTITEGRIYKNNANEIIMGKISSEKENKTVGDKIKLNGNNYKVVGLFESGNVFQDQGAFTGLNKARDLMDGGKNLSSLYVKVDDGAEVEDVEKRIENKYGDKLTTVSSLSDLEMVENIIDMLNGASFAISLLAIIIGAVGIINTMLTSVLERTREIGVLKAVGWSNNKILIMIIGESIVITLVAGIIGSLCGIAGVELLNASDIIPLVPMYTIETFAKAFSIAILVGVIGGIYPAIKAIRLPPTEALRYE